MVCSSSHECVEGLECKHKGEQWLFVTSANVVGVSQRLLRQGMHMLAESNKVEKQYEVRCEERAEASYAKGWECGTRAQEVKRYQTMSSTLTGKKGMEGEFCTLNWKL